MRVVRTTATQVSTCNVRGLAVGALTTSVNLSRPTLCHRFGDGGSVLLNLLGCFVAKVGGHVDGVPMGPGTATKSRLESVFGSRLRAFASGPTVIDIVFTRDVFRCSRKLDCGISRVVRLVRRCIGTGVRGKRGTRRCNGLVGTSALAAVVLKKVEVAMLG